MTKLIKKDDWVQYPNRAHDRSRGQRRNESWQILTPSVADLLVEHLVSCVVTHCAHTMCVACMGASLF